MLGCGQDVQQLSGILFVFHHWFVFNLMLCSRDAEKVLMTCGGGSMVFDKRRFWSLGAGKIYSNFTGFHLLPLLVCFNVFASIVSLCCILLLP